MAREPKSYVKTAVIFNIVHGSFVDGYGVRTTIFLKGCPLKCSWCCNPEGQKLFHEIKFMASKCDGCGRCIDICHAHAIVSLSENSENKIRIDRNLCDRCGECRSLCYSGALDYFGKEMTVDEAFDVLKKDERYYSSSGGGVSIGGGEPTFQPEFTYSLMKKCQEHLIHVAIDTCGYTNSELGFRILEEADQLLYDLKGVDSERHKKNTGASNALILDNLKKLAAMGKPIIIRMPLVPGCNDSEKDIREAAEFIAGMRSVQRVDLLPYHRFGTIKYDQLGNVYELPELQTHAQEFIDRVLSVFCSLGLKVQIGG
jgi:pyruvate formate lyase activating enzyme